MADDPHNTSDISDHAEPAAAKEDAETTAARRELKQTTISEKAGRDAVQLSQDDKSASEDDAPRRRITPPINLSAAKEDVMKEQISSPKKKRAHDELDENKDVADAPLEGAPGKAANTTTIQSRTDRSEPEKKRPRDRQASASAVQGGKEEVVRSPRPNHDVTVGANTDQEPLSASASPRSSMEQTLEGGTDSAKTEKPKQTSTSAFASSGFAKLGASSISPFGSFGGSGKPSLFGSASGSSSLGGVLGGSKPAAPSAPPKLSFGGATVSSPFAGLNGQASGSVFKSSSPFASAFGGSALSGPRLNFGKPGEVLKSDKPARPFGAPESDAEDKSGEESNEDEDTKGEASSDEGDNKEEDKDKDESKAGDDKKKHKLQKIVVDDGEGQEVTLFSVRAKMYLMEKGVGWKERGAGMLKINVPKSTVDLDDNGVADASSFDASVLADEDDDRRKHVRLIMRQDHTLRVILNTVLLPAMKFQVTNRLKTSTVLFTAFEGGVGRQVQMKLSEVNATAFSQLIEMLKKQLADVPAMPTTNNSTPSASLGKRKRGTLPKSTKPPAAAEPEPASSDDDDATTKTTTPTPIEGGGITPKTTTTQKKKRTPKSNPKKPKKNKLDRPPSSESSPPWPPYLTHLEKTHRALNLVSTFLSARRHVAPLFETALRPAVEAHTRCVLAVEDVAAIVSLRAEAFKKGGAGGAGVGVRFEYVDEGQLALSLGEAEIEQEGGGFRISDGVAAGGEKREEVLVFEFLDGELKSDAKGARAREDRLRMPAFSQAQMTRLIERRNARFAQVANEFVEGCVAEGLDPEMVLKDQRERFIPRRMAEAREEETTLTSTLPESIPHERKSIPEIVQEIKECPWYTGQIVPDGHRVFDAQEPVYGELDFLLSQDLVNALYNAKGITQFFAHQAEAINALHEGHHVVVATSTSSGKSLIYQLPVLHALEQDYNTRAMYIFPTKALAQDQRRSLKEMAGLMPGMEEVLVETFDGDTPMSERNTIRDEARIIFTNPDMLHITILPKEDKWRTFLKNLKYVVVDELHYYNGLMGSHVAFIMRRLRRTCAALGNRHVKFISCSATVANPAQHFKTIFGIDDVRLIDFDGSPSGRKEFLCWNTPYKDPGDPASGRGNAMLECSRLFCQLILRGVRVIAFCRVREQCERLVSAIKQELETLGRGEVVARVMGYRGGYTAHDRRRIESEMFEGKLLGIVATTALELGVDIGTLDCVLTWGFPYTIANLRQQSGRAGRRNKDSLSILVGDGFATDQFYMQNPDELFTKPNCEVQVDLDNMLVKEGHIQCAAYEMPIQPAEDTVYFGSDLGRICSERLIQDDTGFYHCHDRFRPVPSKFVSIRDTEEEHFAIIDTTNNRNIVLEELEASRATFTLYDGAIFLHQGDTYLVRDFDPDKRLARVERVKVDWLTSQRDYTDVDPIETDAVKRIHRSRWGRAYYGTIRITQVVFGYFKVDARRGGSGSNRILDAVPVNNPPVVRYSKGMWLDVPKHALDILVARRLHVAGAIHAAQHALMSLIPNFVVSMPGDVRTECKSGLKEFAKRPTQRKRPARLTFYDARGGVGGSGINTKAFEFVDLLLRQALGRVTACMCAAGCVECCASEMCREMNEVMSKAGCEVVLKALLDEPIDVEALPMGPEEASPAGVETVVLAGSVPARDGRGLPPSAAPGLG
ncbi:hypothetical protein C8A00DRAFT_41300 [Chaetomidium leptoderma]|uniref:DEAD/DEAH box helicase n=1 Tax=Chaetomidium leptoderma TaxID=669021 RepID=A0AAN6VR34_9PEZI|nr:hypothetical protein C8A00DRAFT_41300 [Chaetomidium leptoderma]